MDEPEPETLWLLPPGCLSSCRCLAVPMTVDDQHGIQDQVEDPDLHLVVVFTTPGGP